MFLDWIMDRMDAYLTGILSSPIEIIALGAAIAAALLTITSSFVKTMVPLRWLAVCSNFGFFAYGVLHGAPVMAVLHAILLPINLLRLRQMRKLTQNVQAAAAGSRHLRRVAAALHEGQAAQEGRDPVPQGRRRRPALPARLRPGRVRRDRRDASARAQVFGEIAFFAPHGRRTLTARCVEDCAVLSLNQETLRQIYYQNPSFGFELIGLVAGRLSADVARLEEQLAQAKAGVREL